MTRTLGRYFSGADPHPDLPFSWTFIMIDIYISDTVSDTPTFPVFLGPPRSSQYGLIPSHRLPSLLCSLKFAPSHWQAAMSLLSATGTIQSSCVSFKLVTGCGRGLCVIKVQVLEHRDPNRRPGVMRTDARVDSGPTSSFGALRVTRGRGEASLRSLGFFCCVPRLLTS